MPSKRRIFQRKLGERRYRKLFVISVEGFTTEPQYFSIFNDLELVIHVDCLKDKNESSPIHVLRRMKKHLKETKLRNSDEAWLVVDKDQWTDEQLTKLYAWSEENENFGFALSNPKFEYWLLLHFEEGFGIVTSRQCSERLVRYLPDYEKSIDAHKISPERIADAVRRAKERDNPPCRDWPRNTGTTVYRLVTRLLNKSE
jgi:hypothetical protein